MVGVAARPAAHTPKEMSEQGGFAAYGTPSPNVADPMSRSIEGLLDELGRLRARLEQLENASPNQQTQNVSGEEAGDAKGEAVPPNC
jgi:serine O-acetyltransferase